MSSAGRVTLVKGRRWSWSCALTERHAMKAYWESGGIAPRIFDLCTRWRWEVSFTSVPLYPQGKSPWYPSDRRLGGLQNRSGHGGGEKSAHSPPELEPPAVQPAAQRCTTELSLPLTLWWVGGEKCIQNRSRKTSRKEATSATWA
jgi:hypothetical protein